MIGCFGKVPASADFIGLHGAAEEVREFDAWLHDGLAHLAVGDWHAAFDSLPVCFFCYQARSGNWLLGGFISSRDASQRRYPFMIFQLLKGVPGHALVNPFTLSELFAAQIKPLLHLAVQNASVALLFERLKALRPLQSQDVALFERVHRKFLHDFDLADIAKALQPAYPAFASAALPGRLAQLLPTVRNNHGLAVRGPLPAERGLKNPVADLWLNCLVRLGLRPPVSLLADDFLRPSLLSFTTRRAPGAYGLLNANAAQEACYDLLAPGPSAPAQPWPSDRLPLIDFIDRFVEMLDVTPV